MEFLLGFVVALLIIIIFKLVQWRMAERQIERDYAYQRKANSNNSITIAAEFNHIPTNETVDDVVVKMIQNNQTVKAIKYIREEKGMSLLEAKEYVDSRSNLAANNHNMQHHNAGDEDLKSLIRNGEKVKAIKHVHQEKGMSLTASKAYVEKLSVQDRIGKKQSLSTVLSDIKESLYDK
ncbi:hypothetical protein G7062_04775 [Erysipelothrix sp. HDW6C]|uniref:hypothetical protein n=1 Tax=Erysipelothrix sp. HDW6C TaxID=2714930 RepID=UPI001409F803|nr:hypothetical protein [Erysipelothrix sp. HDW6C]QIK69651.1 hypothetical protein G7062_04775 [Erysipelothrix sp. HDW6C]